MSVISLTPHNILLAVDGSDHSLAAVRLLQDLPLNDPNQQECSVTVIGALLPRESSNYAAHQVPLDTAHKMLSKQGYGVCTELITGHPAEVIIKYSQEHDPDLIIVGARGLRATLGILLGGTAQQVVEYAHCPVLVVRAPYQELRRILLLTDGSAHSQWAIEYLIGFPKPRNCEIYIAHVLPPPPLIDPLILARTWPVEHQVIQTIPPVVEEELKLAQHKEEQEGKELLQRNAEILSNAGLKANPVLLQGDAATEIIKFSHTEHIDLIVSGSRGLSQMQGWLLGSVSRKLVHYANCSVLIAKKPHGEKGDSNE